MNYFLILGIIVMIVFFLGLLLNNVNKIIQQSEKNDVIFTLLGFMLALSIFVMFAALTSTLNAEYMRNLKQQTIEMTLDTSQIMSIKDSNYLTLIMKDKIINVKIDENTQYVANPSMTGKVKVILTTFDAPDAWYMFKWQVEALNRLELYVAKIVYI